MDWYKAITCGYVIFAGGHFCVLVKMWTVHMRRSYRVVPEYPEIYAIHNVISVRPEKENHTLTGV